MKRFFLLTAVLLPALGTFAQPQSGKIFAGGSLSMNYTTNKTKDGSSTSTDSKTFSCYFGPEAGFFLSSRIAVGSGLGFSGSVYHYPNAFNDKSSSFGFSMSPFIRYYLSQGNMGIFFEAELSGGVGNNKTYAGDVSTTRNFHSFGTSIAPGIYYYISPRIVLEAQPGNFGWSYLVRETGGDTKDTESNVGFNLQTGLALGFKIMIN